ncbi:MAG TPA: hypothetical protein VEC12_12340 [Bacteroidia bacterium]|nr:hypothetical protein [Bacteroidia bacterium]
MTTNDILNKAVFEVTTARTETGNLLARLSNEQLLWRPAADKWN